MIIHVALVLSSVVVTDQLRQTRSFIGAYSSKSTLSVIVLVFLKSLLHCCHGLFLKIADYRVVLSLRSKWPHRLTDVGQAH